MSSAILQALTTSRGTLPALDDGTLRLTYAQLQRSVAQESDWLQSMGVRRCGLLAENSTRWIVSDLSLLACEALNVPLPGYFTSQQIGHVLEDAAIDSVLTDDPARIMQDHPAFVSVATSHRTGLALLRREGRVCASKSADVAKVTYTSGSTGTPKGVCLSQRSIESVAESLRAATAELKIAAHLCLLPLPTLLENIAGVYVPLMMGAKIIVPPCHAIGMSYGGLNVPLLLRAIDAAAPQSMILVPELLRVLLAAMRMGWSAPSALQFVAVGGGAVSVELMRQAQAAGLPVFEGYGLSECASVVCLNTPAHNKLGSVGRPLRHARVRIDRNGEICVSGATMSGYLNGPANDAAEVRTGDLGEIDADGFVYVRGRAKNMFITSLGRNVTPEWVESELTSEPVVLQAMVTGEAKHYPVALLVVAAGVTEDRIDQAILRANSRLPDYARVHRWALFPEVPTLTNGLLTANGRFRRAQVLARHHDLIGSLYDHEVESEHEFS